VPTAKECRYNAEACLKLANEAREIYARTALIELAQEFRALAQQLERDSNAPQEPHSWPSKIERRLRR
jgi:hypothetical protein